MKCKMSNKVARGVASVQIDARMTHGEMSALITGMEEYAQKSFAAKNVMISLKNARDEMWREMNSMKELS